LVQPVGRLKRRAEFLRVADARRKWAAPGLVLQAARAPEAEADAVRVGFTATKRLGSAVVRNRAKRRLRAAAAAVLPAAAKPGHHLVLIGRSETLSRKFSDLKTDVAAALAKLGIARS
jgi:ribonuclease P protein component